MAAGRKRIAAFDLICLFSCLCVSIVHFNAAVCGYNGTFLYPQNSLIPNFYIDGKVYLGGIGVSLFFMLSGARLMYTYKDAKTFFIHRFKNIYPMFWIAYAAATCFDFLYYKGMSTAKPWLRIFSALGMDGYLCSLGVIPFDYYKLGEWFLGCIILIYLLFPLLHAAVERNMAVTAVCAGVIYMAFRGKVSDQSFFLRIPEILFGMAFVKYDLNDKPLPLLAGSAGVFILAYLFRAQIYSLTVCVAFCVFLFALMVWAARYIQSDAVKSFMAVGAKLTYPIFLVHHWLITRLMDGFSPEWMNRQYVWMMFLIYTGLTLILAYALDKCSNGLLKRLRKK